jgi:hypothetical protein
MAVKCENPAKIESAPLQERMKTFKGMPERVEYFLDGFSRRKMR